MTKGWASFEDKYSEIKTQFIAEAFSETTVNALLAQWKAQVQEATLEASEKYGDAISISEWESALTKLQSQVDYAREH